MTETIDSVMEYGILTPAIVRPRQEGGYEVVADHRRKYACDVSGLADLPAIAPGYADRFNFPTSCREANGGG